MENEFEVEKILGKRTKRNGQILYHLKWKGFPESENSWEPLRNLNCPAKIAEFERSQKSKNNVLARKRKTTETRTVYSTARQKVQAGGQDKLNNNSQATNKNMSAESIENTVEFGTPDLTSTLQNDMLDSNFSPNNSEHSQPIFQMPAHQLNLNTDDREASTSYSNLGHGSKHDIDVQSSSKSKTDNFADENSTSEDDIVFIHKTKRTLCGLSESGSESSFEAKTSSIQCNKKNEVNKMQPITNLGFIDIKEGFNNGTIGILDENPNDSIQKLYYIKTKQEICGYFTCKWCGSILKYISHSYCDSLRRHRLNCRAPLGQKINISPTNFRSLISGIMNFVVVYGTVDITEIDIPTNMNKNNCNELIENMSEMKQTDDTVVTLK